MKLDRRGFLFGVGATAALTAFPISALDKVVSAASLQARPFLGEMDLLMVGPIAKSDAEMPGYIPMDFQEIRHMMSATEIDVAALTSNAREFALGLADPGRMHIKGWISQEIVQACEDATRLKSAIRVPNPFTNGDSYFSFECIVTGVRPVDGRGA